MNGEQSDFLKLKQLLYKHFSWAPMRVVVIDRNKHISTTKVSIDFNNKKLKEADLLAVINTAGYYNFKLIERKLENPLYNRSIVGVFSEKNRSLANFGGNHE